MGLIDRIQAKIELFRLEQRYTRRRHRRSTFVSNAVYVDGEYIYQSPNTTGSSSNTTRSAATSTTTTTTTATNSTMTVADEQPSKQTQKRLNRWSSMPGFGSSAKGETMGSMPTVREREQEWRGGRVSFGDERRY